MIKSNPFQTASPWRRNKDLIMRGLCWASMAAVIVPLCSLLLYVLFQGTHRFDLNFFRNLPAPVGVDGGGMANGIIGTLELVGIGSLIGVPVGVMAGVYLAEFGGRGNRLAFWVGYLADVLTGVPSIVTGIFAYEIVVRPLHGFSALAGGFALGSMMVPVVTRATEEMMRLVPGGLREASLALGISQWKTTLSVVLRTAQSGIATGVLLALARVAGETAPLLFTSFSNQFWPGSPMQPTASLTVQIFTYAISPFEDWHNQAWTGALVLLLMVLLVSLASRMAFSRSKQTIF
jgi:phosphate transport system permease protein